MKKLIILLAIAIPSLAQISTSPVHQTLGAIVNPNSSGTITIPAAANGNTLIMPSEFGGGASPTVTSLSTTNVTWTASPVIASATHFSVQIWCGTVAGGSSGTSVAVTLSGAVPSSSWRGNVSEWSGVTSCTPAGVTPTSAAHGTTSGTTMDPGSVTPTATQNVLMIVIGNYGSTASSGPTNSFTSFTVAGALCTGYRVVSSASGSYDSTYGISSTSNWDAALAVFPGASVGGSTPFIPVIYDAQKILGGWLGRIGL
jgi:hypothetical protein